MKHLTRMALATTALSLLLVPAIVPVAQASNGNGIGDGDGDGHRVTVMTRNIYLGADIGRPLNAVAGKTGAAALVALGNADHKMAEIVAQTNFPVRSKLLAAEIARTRPDLIGLQEVALWRSGPIELPPSTAIGVPNATHVDYDFLQTLLDELGATGASYHAVSVQNESDVEGPSFLGNPFTGTMTDPSDRRLTMRDVILVRDEAPLEIVDHGSRQYVARLDLSVGGLPASFVRGYNWADVRSGSKTFRFINTHLESASSDLALAQAGELLAGPASYDGTTIVVCDCNSDPLNNTVKPSDLRGTPHSGPYNFITGSGFTDEWLNWAPASDGWSSGLSEAVTDATAVKFDHRIDMVFARGAKKDGLKVDAGQMTGNEVSDRDPATGLWPSDHAGVVLTLKGLH